MGSTLIVTFLRRCLDYLRNKIELSEESTREQTVLHSGYGY